MPTWHRSIALSSLLFLSFAGCGPTPAAPLEPERWRLDDRTGLDAGGRFLVSPRWTGEGRLVAAGRGGVGALALDLKAGTITVLSAEHGGPIRVDADGRLSEAARPEQDGFITLFGNKTGQVRFMPYTGQLISAHAKQQISLANAGAWGVAVSPTGQRVAWCDGHLPVAHLHVSDLAGRPTFSGSGAQPAWLPDGRRLVFVRPRSRTNASGRDVLVGGKLVLLDTVTGKTVALDETPGRFDMQPDPSPDGRRLVWSDWRTGQLFTARLVTSEGSP